MQGQILRSSFDPLGLHATCDRLRVQAPSLTEDNVSPIFDGSDNYVNGVYVPSRIAPTPEMALGCIALVDLCSLDQTHGLAQLRKFAPRKQPTMVRLQCAGMLSYA